MTNAEICELMGWHPRMAESAMGDLLEKVRKVIAAEREACAKVCEQAGAAMAWSCAAAIRARGQQPATLGDLALSDPKSFGEYA